MTAREDALIAALARARGITPATVRVEYPEPERRYVCECCGHVWNSDIAALACAESDDLRD